MSTSELIEDIKRGITMVICVLCLAALVGLLFSSEGYPSGIRGKHEGHRPRPHCTRHYTFRGGEGGNEECNT